MLIMTVNNSGEQEFFLKHLKPHMRVLEWGSGASTSAIAPHVRELVSIENNSEWHEKVKATLPDNVTLCYVPANSEPKPEYDDGTFEDFRDYVEHPLQFVQQDAARFDFIFIDGRARVACAQMCKQVGHVKTIVFIHDFNHPDEKYLRREYFAAEKYLKRIGGIFTMWRFKIR